MDAKGSWITMYKSWTTSQPGGGGMIILEEEEEEDGGSLGASFHWTTRRERERS